MSNTIELMGGGISGMSEADVRAAYARVAAERDALRAALDAVIAIFDEERVAGEDSRVTAARAALAQGGES